MCLFVNEMNLSGPRTRCVDFGQVRTSTYSRSTYGTMVPHNLSLYRLQVYRCLGIYGIRYPILPQASDGVLRVFLPRNTRNTRNISNLRSMFDSHRFRTSYESIISILYLHSTQYIVVYFVLSSISCNFLFGLRSHSCASRLDFSRWARLCHLAISSYQEICSSETTQLRCR